MSGGSTSKALGSHSWLHTFPRGVQGGEVPPVWTCGGIVPWDCFHTKEGCQALSCVTCVPPDGHAALRKPMRSV